MTDGEAVSVADVRRAAMDLLARREHSRIELRRKLSRRFGDAEEIDEALERLLQQGLQCDQRFAEGFVRQRFTRGHGPLRIRQEMRQRGIPDVIIESALESEEYDWHASAQSVLERKYGSGPAVDTRERARRTRFMQYRGFSLEHFRACF